MQIAVAGRIITIPTPSKETLLRVKDRVIIAAMAAVFTISLAYGVAARNADDIEEQTATTVDAVLKEAEQTRDLFCAVIAFSDNKEIREAIRKYCD